MRRMSDSAPLYGCLIAAAAVILCAVIIFLAWGFF